MIKQLSRMMLLFVGVFLIVACAPKNYVPEEFAIDPKRIPDFESRGTVKVLEAGASTKPVKVYTKGDRSVSADYKAMTDTMVKQLKLEMFRRGVGVTDSGEKILKITVTHAEVKSALMSFKSSMNFMVELGNGIKQKYIVRNTSTGSVPRTLNGNIARCVIHVLKNKTVLDYLNADPAIANEPAVKPTGSEGEQSDTQEVEVLVPELPAESSAPEQEIKP